MWYKGRKYANPGSPREWLDKTDPKAPVAVPLEMYPELDRANALKEMRRAGIKKAGPPEKPLGSAESDQLLPEHEELRAAGYTYTKAVELQSDRHGKTFEAIAQAIARGRRRRRGV